uniref:Uncharacterized protein n=1 Tax=Timema tahoe TaxID=61484 RepID=A0A7R9ILR2_9NEOP|nr:unnamed protein product [Timema tahoe]
MNWTNFVPVREMDKRRTVARQISTGKTSAAVGWKGEEMRVNLSHPIARPPTFALACHWRVSKELTNWIMQMIHRSEPAMCPHKRNSELINSLLALPKVLNDAGRK